MFRYLVSLAFVIILLGLPSVSAQTELGRNLAELKFYDGETLLTATDAWSTSTDGLNCQGTPKGYLMLEELASNYELSLEWRWETDEGGNSGLLLHAVEGTSGFRTWPSSIEVQLKKGMAGDIYAIGQLVGFRGEGSVFVVPGVPVVRMDRRSDAEQSPTEWNRLRVIARDDTISVYINGELVNEVFGVKPKFGGIALQSEGAPIQFRHINLKELPQ